ncbi:MAG: hypothetical protein JNL11_01065 [Bdellovibrionaceae bacterium]|nr:hypothetical protein [Pseudobdellovibrionaceae bacterium]
MPKYVLKSFLAGFFSVTFTVSPFAMAANQTEIDNVKKLVKATPMTGSKSYIDFYTDLSKKYPKADKFVLKQLARMFGNEKLPKTQVQEFKYKGQSALKMMVTRNNQTIVFEILNNGNEVMKIDGVLFTKEDTKNRQAYDKRLKTVPAFAKIYSELKKNVFSKSHVPTSEQWARLGIGQRAEYYLRFRELLEAAYKVHNTPAFQVTSTDTYKSFEDFIQKAFIGQEAYADMTVIGGSGGSAPKPAAPTASPQTVSGKEAAVAQEKAKTLAEEIGYNAADDFRGADEEYGPSCIVGGYSMEWKKSSNGTYSCPWNGGKGNREFFQRSKFSKECNNPNLIACNPVVYGFTQEGKPHCIDTSDKNTFNRATHGDGPCEKKSPLKTADDKKAFLMGIMKRAKIGKEDLLEVKDGVLYSKDANFHAKIMKELREPLLKYIKSAEKICSIAETDSNNKPTKYKYSDDARRKKGIKIGTDPALQDGACDGLMKRAWAVEDLLTIAPSVSIAKACDGWGPEGSFEEVPGANGASATCKCKDGQAATDKCCPPSKPATGVPAAAPSSLPQEEVAATVAGATTADSADCGDWQNRVTFAGSCSWGMSDVLTGLGLLLGGSCIIDLVGDTHILGNACNSHNKKRSNPAYVDPAPTPVNPEPTQPTDPTPAPPLTSETTNQTAPAPVIDSAQPIPAAPR